MKTKEQLDLLSEISQYDGSWNELNEFVTQQITLFLPTVYFKIIHFDESCEIDNKVSEWLLSIDQLAFLINKKDVPYGVSNSLFLGSDVKFLLPLKKPTLGNPIDGFILLSDISSKELSFFQNLPNLIYLKRSAEQLKQQLPKIHLVKIYEHLHKERLHEVKNKLIAPKTFLQSFMKKEDSKANISNLAPLALEEIDSAIDSIQVSHSHLFSSNNKLNDLSSLATTINVVKNLFQIQLNKNNIILISKNTDLPYFPIPQESLKEVLVNLLLNSIKASISGVNNTAEKTIIIRGFNERKDYGFLIQNEGRTIKKENINKVFKAFYSDSVGGTGLGLYIVKKTIIKAKGRIELITNENKTTFKISFNHA